MEDFLDIATGTLDVLGADSLSSNITFISDMTNVESYKGNENAVKIFTLGDLINKGTSLAVDTKEIYGILSDLEGNKDLLNETGKKYLGNLLDYLTAFEEVQNIIKVYRTSKLIVEKAVSIGGIIWNFANTAKLAQDVLQILSRVFVTKVKNKLLEIWEELLQFPIFAIYYDEDTDSQEILEKFSELQDYFNSIANKEILKILEDLASALKYEEIIKITNDYIIDNETKEFGTNLEELLKEIDTDFLFALSKDLALYFNKGALGEIKLKDDSVKEYNNLPTIISVTSDFDKNTFYALGEDKKIYYFEKDSYKVFNENVGSTVKEIFFFKSELYLKKDNGRFKKNSGGNLINSAADNVYIYDNIIYTSRYDSTNNKTYFCSYDGEVFDDLFEVPSKIEDFAYFKGKFYCITREGLKIIDRNFSFKRFNNNFNTTFIDPDLKILSIKEGIFNYSLENSKVLKTDLTRLEQYISGVDKQGDYYLATSGSDLVFFNEGSQPSYRVIEYKDELLTDYLRGIKTISNGSSTETYIISGNKIILFKGLYENLSLSNINLLQLEAQPTVADFNEEESDKEIDVLEAYCIKEIEGEITSIKKFNNNIYIAVYDRSRSGIYKLSLSDSKISLSLVLSVPDRKIFSFCNMNSSWYLLTLNDVLDEKLNKIEGLELLEGEVLLELYDNGESLSIVTNKAILEGSLIKEQSDVTSFVEFSDYSIKSIASTDDYLLFSDGRFLYLNDGKKLANREIYQIIGSSDSSIDLIQNKDCILSIIDGYLVSAPTINGVSKNHKWHNGLKTDLIPFKREGIASYFNISKVLENIKLNIDRNRFLSKLENDFKSEFCLLCDEVQPALINYISEQLEEKLSEEEEKVEDLNKEMVKYLKHTTLNSKTRDISLRIIDSFGFLKNNQSNIDSFYSDLIQKLRSSNDLVESFYSIFSNYFNEALDEAGENFRDYDIREEIITYFQDHKLEWQEQMKDLVSNKSFDIEEIKNNVDLDSSLQIVLEDYSNTLLNVNSNINDILLNKSGVITEEDYDSILSLINDISLDIDNDKYEPIKNEIERLIDEVYKIEIEKRFVDSVNESNMNPIQWQELPVSINKAKFKILLDTILEVIRKEIIDKIEILITKGKVKCYSCVDSSQVSKKVFQDIKQNFYNIKRTLKAVVISFQNSNKTYESFNLEFPNISFEVYEDLENIIKTQTGLYATYTNKIIEEQISPSEEEVDLKDLRG